MKILAIDPGVTGAIVCTDGKLITSWEMPLELDGKNKSIEFDGLIKILMRADSSARMPVFLERAMPFAMGSKHAFNYGRGFETIVIALKLLKFSVTYVEPSKWTKEMHEGISGDLKPKVKSAIAVKRLFPHLVRELPTKPKGGMHDGMIDALLIAGYGLRKLGITSNQAESEDFF